MEQNEETQGEGVGWEEITKELIGMYALPTNTDNRVVKAWDRARAVGARGKVGRTSVILSTIKYFF